MIITRVIGHPQAFDAPFIYADPLPEPTNSPPITLELQANLVGFQLYLPSRFQQVAVDAGDLPANIASAQEVNVIFPGWPDEGFLAFARVVYTPAS